MPMGYLIGIDFGTSNTVGVLQSPEGRSETLLFDGSPALLSGVCLDANGQFLTGRDAAHVARTRPDAFEPNPKRRIDDGTVLLGGRDVPVPRLLAAVLGRVMAEAARATGRPPERVVLTHPVAWGPRRLEVLKQAAALAGIKAPLLVPEPVAAAFSFLGRPRVQFLPGQSAVVYDFGGGTFDATVVRRTDSGFEVVSYDGLDDVGGLDIDAAIFQLLGSSLGFRASHVWERLQMPTTPTDRRAARLLWDDVRQAKETLSRTSTVHIHVPLLDDDLPLGREQLEGLARPLLERTVTTTRRVISSAGAVSTVLLVGGSSRFPLVATVLHQQLGIPPTVVENPELVVARGAVLVGNAFSPAPAVASVPPGPAPAAPPVRRSRRRWVLGAAAGLVALIVLACGGLIGAHALAGGSSDDDSGSAVAAPSAPVCTPRLAYLGSETGTNKDLGVRVHNGVELAVSQYNANHSGCDVALKSYDTGSNASRAGELATTIAKDTATVGVIGPVSPAEMAAAGAADDRAGLPLISPVGDAVGLSDWKTFHQVIGDENSSALFAKPYLVDTLKASRVYLADDGSRRAAELSGIIGRDLGDLSAGRETVKTDPAAIQALAGRIKASEASAVFYTGTPAPAGRLRKALSDDDGEGIQLVGTSDLDAAAYFREAGPAADGTVVFGPYLPPADSPAAFRSAYKKAYGSEAGRYSAEAYDATKVFLDGIAAGQSDRERMLAYVNSYDANGLTKHLKFNELGDLASPVMWLYRATNGTFAPIGKLTQ